MATIPINIDFRIIVSHAQLTEVLSPAFTATENDVVNFQININSYSLLYSDYLLLIVSTVDYLRKNNIKIEGNILGLGENPARANYASRVDFFKHLGAPFIEEFERQEATGKFTEIRVFNEDTALSLFDDIMRILINNKVDENVLAVLNFCLWEVIDNTLNHSGVGFTYGVGSGFACAQYFPNRNELRIMIADNGVGVHYALTQHPNSKFKHLSAEEAVWSCVDKNVTNSAGMGFGLWATAEMIRENAGELIVYSGNHQLVCTTEKTIAEKSNWKGTFTFLKINTNIPVNHEVIFDKHHDKMADFLEYKENLLGNIDNLW